MPRPALPATATLAVLLAAGAAAAQPPTAPPPHPTLDELVREYRRLGLPEPPPNAELVRFGFRDNNPDRLSFLAFKTPPKPPGAWPRYWVGGRTWDREQSPAHWEELAGPGAEAAHGLAPGDADKRVVLAVQCQLHGRPELARAVFDSALAELWERTEDRDPSDETPEMILRSEAWWYWAMDQLDKPGTDRREPLRRLRALAVEDRRLRNVANLKLIEDLEFTINCPPARPGTVESLIDSLTEYAGDSYPHVAGQAPHPGYWRLVELGFDAVPALLDHLDDPRVTRWYVYLGNLAIPFRARIGYVAAELLGHLAGHDERRSWNLPWVKVDAEKARRWWAEARQGGEEKWLLDRVIPPEAAGGGVGPNEFMLRTLRAKYPARLPGVYRSVLAGRGDVWSGRIADEIRASNIPREQQVALFKEGARNANRGHQSVALDALGRIDPALIRGQTLQAAKGLAADPAAAVVTTFRAGRVAELVELAADRACWDALLAAAPKLAAADRREVIMEVGMRSPSKPDPFRRQRLRLLLGFLGDAERDPTDESDDAPGLEIQDYAADRLALLLGLRPWTESDDPFVGNWPNRERGPLTRIILRLAVRQAAERELRRLGG